MKHTVEYEILKNEFYGEISFETIEITSDKKLIEMAKKDLKKKLGHLAKVAKNWKVIPNK